MARNGKFKGGKRQQKSFNNKFKKNYNKKPNRYMMVKKQIEKNKESEENLKRQQLVELKYKKTQRLEEEENLDGLSEEDNPEEDVNHFQELVQTFKKRKRNDDNGAETSDSSESEASDLEEHDKENENQSGAEEEDEMAAEEEEENEEDDSSSNEEEGEDLEEIEMSETEETNETSTIEPDKTISTDFLDESIANDLNREIEEEEEEDFSSDLEDEETKSKNMPTAPFDNHFSFNLSPKLLENISSNALKTETKSLLWSTLGNLTVEIPKASQEQPETKKRKVLLEDEEVYSKEGSVPKLFSDVEDLTSELSIKKQLIQKVIDINSKIVEESDQPSVTPLQKEILSLIGNYQDFYYPYRKHETGEQIRLSYCTHAVNHVMRTRKKILHHNAKLAKLRDTKKNVIIPDDFKDQGFVRPKVLIILPFRESAYRAINMIIDLLNPKEKAGVFNYKRFVDEFTGQTLHFPKKNPKPEDYELTFAGNTEDTFRIGISLTKSSLKLYSPFYASDILIASPLGLRLIIGAPGEKDREFDFLASIELLILDQMELFLAQNWDHLLYIFDHLHLQPQSRQNTDFSRVRDWCLNGWSKFYRQTILVSSYDLPEFRSLLNNRCKNYHGKVKTVNKVAHGTIRHVVMEVPQVFHRIEVKSLESSFDTRFEYFTNTILPQFKSATMAHSMIYVPSYFDFVRIRNYLKKEEVNFTQICEYTKDNKISRARTLFYHGGAHFLLYSERAHFFRRMRIKGIRHIIMYQPPLWSNFYPEMLNLMQEINQNPRDDVMKNAMSVTVLYTKYDILQLSAIVGHENVSKMLSSKRNTHMFMNNE